MRLDPKGRVPGPSDRAQSIGVAPPGSRILDHRVERGLGPPRVPSLLDCLPRAARELTVKVQVVHGKQPEGQDFPGHVEMPQKGAGESPRAARAIALLVERAGVLSPSSLLD